MIRCLRFEGGDAMRGIFRDQAQLFSYVSPESRVPSGHPLRKIHSLVRDMLKELVEASASSIPGTDDHRCRRNSC